MTHEDLKFKVVENEQELKDALKFLKRILPRKVDEKIWEWEYESLPGTVRAIIMRENEVVGSQVMLPIMMNIGGRDVKAGKSETSYLDESLRGKGLFKKLYHFGEDESLKAGMQFLWGYTTAVYVMETTMQFAVPRDKMYEYSVAVGAPSFSLLKRYSKGIVNLMKSYVYYYQKHKEFRRHYAALCNKVGFAKNIAQYEIRSEFNAAHMDRFYTSLRAQYPPFTYIKFTDQYWNWRITRNPNLNYITRFFYQNGQLVGYYVYSIVNATANVADFSFLNMEAGNVMLCQMFKEVVEANGFTVNYWGNKDNLVNKKLFELLLQLGGSAKVNRMNFVYKTLTPLNEDDEFLKTSENWYMNGIWTEGFYY